MPWLYWVYYLTLIVIMLSGLVLNLLTLPGIWLLTLGVMLYAWATGFGHYVGWGTLITLVIIGLIAELIEFIAGGAGAKKAGGTRWGAWGAVAGSLLGAILGGILIPIPLAGSIIGVIAGAFLGAGLVEMCISPDHCRAARIGMGAAKGRVMGMIAKTGFGLVMFLIAAFMALPIGGSAPAAGGSTSPTGGASTPATSPATQPATTTATQPGETQPNVSQPAPSPSLPGNPPT